MTASAEARSLERDDAPSYVTAALLLAVAAVLLYAQNNDFPFGVHLDETKKVRFILGGEQDFMHPILMLQVSRAANWFAGLSDPEAVVRLGRAMSALFGGLYVFGSFLLARRSLPGLAALAVAAAVALIPLTAIHAQALKEDIYASAFLILTLVALISYAEAPSRGPAILLGVLAGCAISSKYVASLILVVILLVPFLCAVADRPAYWKGLALAFAAGAAVVLTLNLPALISPDNFGKGVAYEVNHVTKGHGGVFHGPFSSYLMHYLREGLIKGAGGPLAIAGVIGMIGGAFRWRRIPDALRIPLLFGALWYFAHELAPMKPGVSRYMTPMGAIVCLFAAVAVRDVVSWVWPRYATAAAIAAVVAFATWPASKTVAYFAAGDSDTSLTAVRFADSLGGSVFKDRGIVYPGSGSLDSTANQNREKIDGAFAELTSQWNYAITRNLTGTRVTADEAQQSATKRFYGLLSQRPYVEIEHVWREYEFRNRRIRIYDLQGDGAKMADAIKSWAWPETVRVRFVPASG